MAFDILQTLDETKMFRTVSSLDRLTPKQTADFFFLHIIGLEILKKTYSTLSFAQDYAKKIYRFKSLENTQTSSVDLYQLAWALHNKDKVFSDTKGNDIIFAERIQFDRLMFVHYIERIVNNRLNQNEDRRYTLKLCAGLQQDSTYRAMRRLAIDWDTLTVSQREVLMTRLLQAYRKHIIKSDLYQELKKIADEQELIMKGVFNPETGQVDGTTAEVNATLSQNLVKGALTAAGAYAVFKMLRHKK